MSEDRYTVDDVVVIGRTAEEYRQMFDLAPGAVAGRRVLDCPGGACSFVSWAADRGIDAVAADVVYDRTPAALARVATRDVERAMAGFDGVEDRFRWDRYGDVAGVRAHRERAASRFLRDYAANGERYVAGTLPSLPFPDDAFDLVLSGHFLFLYDDRLDGAFHLEVLRELLRVGGEVRVFPLSGFDCERSALVGGVVATLRADGVAVETADVPYEFQRGADEMLVARG